MLGIFRRPAIFGIGHTQVMTTICNSSIATASEEFDGPRIVFWYPQSQSKCTSKVETTYRCNLAQSVQVIFIACTLKILCGPLLILGNLWSCSIDNAGVGTCYCKARIASPLEEF